MKAVVIKQQNGEVALEKRERPSSGPGQVLIRVHACGACHSDLAVLQGAATHDVRPQITKRPLEDAADVLNEMHERRLRGRVVLAMA